MFSGLIALLFASFIGGTVSPILVKLGTREIPPLTFSALRFALAIIIFLPIYLNQKNFFLKRKDIISLSLASIPFTLNIAFFSIGIQFTTAIMSQIFYASGSLIVMILAFYFLKERFTLLKIVGLLLALFGTAFLIQKSALTGETSTFGTPLGNILVLCAVFSYASYLVISQKMTKIYSPQTTSFFGFLTTAALLTIASPFELSIRPFTIENITGTSILTLVGLALFSSALYFFLVQFGIKRTSAFAASLFHYTAPFFAAITAIPIFGEQPTPELFIGGLFIIIGVFLATTYEQLKRIR